MRVKIKFILLFLINILIVINLVYLLFGLINTASFEVISMFKNDPFNNMHQDFITEYHTLIIFTLVFVCYGWILSKPLFHILEWINYLAQDKYCEPVDKKGFPQSKSKRSDKLKLTFIFFGSIIRNLQYLTSTLIESKKEREKIEKMKKEWVADIAHDLKTPLSYIKGYSSMLLSNNQWTDEERRKFLNRIEEKTEYMESLLMNLNDIFKFDSKSLDVRKEQQDLVNFIREILIDLANDPMAEEYHIQFINHIGEYVPYTFDPLLIKRVLHNLINNAIVHNPKGTSIDIILDKDDIFVVIVIKDNGIGMDEVTTKHLFNRYHRGNSNSRSGLGMTIAKQFVDAHHGNITVQSEVSKGTTVNVYLPL
ncbi:HAMP domain-containing histidine kinase [Ureibacillus sp. Re31]|uniref:histidine kinase n=1 Tax=Ureibacillus galli TaxID=2762222 RepID=A0ABR8XGW3_9BACL|nr:HAMP domain-containing sensor histidine kinase [Ureibacillus galli]MBD8028467.1 HAMP domain-containing histidine kinase [Ureibacillus galli]